jgi:hypothetical protein
VAERGVEVETRQEESYHHPFIPQRDRERGRKREREEEREREREETHTKISRRNKLIIVP